MIDKEPLAVEISKKNALVNKLDRVNIIISGGLKNIDQNDFTKILINPPHHVDFSVPKHFIEKGFNRLRIGGEIWLVTRRLKWYRKK